MKLTIILFSTLLSLTALASECPVIGYNDEGFVQSIELTEEEHNSCVQVGCSSFNITNELNNPFKIISSHVTPQDLIDSCEQKLANAKGDQGAETSWGNGSDADTGSAYRN